MRKGALSQLLTLPIILHQRPLPHLLEIIIIILFLAAHLHSVRIVSQYFGQVYRLLLIFFIISAVNPNEVENQQVECNDEGEN